MLKNITLLIFVFALGTPLANASDTDLAAVQETNRLVRAAFVAGDIEEIVRFHHPEVRKVFSWTNYQKGHDDMRTALAALFAHHTISFQNEGLPQPNIELLGDTAVMLVDFVLVGAPKTPEVAVFEYSGRAMLVYVRSAESPTGWVIFREMAVPKEG